jgi:hypothetical protein
MPLSPKATQEIILNTAISAKFAAFAGALTLSSLLIAGVACMFNVSVEQTPPESATLADDSVDASRREATTADAKQRRDSDVTGN